MVSVKRCGVRRGKKQVVGWVERSETQHHCELLGLVPQSNLPKWPKLLNIALKRKLMEKTIFEITKMDCPSEENLIRMQLDKIPEIKNLEFDIPNRKLTVIHTGKLEEIESSVMDLKLGGKRLRTEQSDQVDFKEQTNQRKLLWAVLAINIAFFIIEMTTGLISKSMGLVADSLDMLADSFVYGISLLAVGGTLARKRIFPNSLDIFKSHLLLLDLQKLFGDLSE